jgi:hypothetical protein
MVVRINSFYSPAMICVREHCRTSIQGMKLAFGLKTLVQADLSQKD